MTAKGYDLQQLEALAGGSREFIDSMVATFLEHTPVQLNEMLDAYKNDDLIVMGNIAHKIKPNIDLFQIEEIRDNIRTVENQGKTETRDAKLEHSIQEVDRVLKIVFDQLRTR